MEAALFLTLFSATGLFLILGGYPLLLWLRHLGTKAVPESPEPARWPDTTLIVVVHNGEALIREKIENSLALDYPVEHLQLLICSDGSTDGTVKRVRALAREHPRIRLFEAPERQGKNLTLDAGVASCDSEILVFSDADARLHTQALKRLIAPLADPEVGGVCGQRVIGGDSGALSEPQQDYIRFDSTIKALESRLGSITSNDGKLYAMRRSLYRGMARAVTDDLYNCLQVVEQGRRFVFAPRALAFIRTPSRNPVHELHRRRRIIARSLNGIRLMRSLLNPGRGFQYAAGLFINKVLRRALPLFMLGLFLGSLQGAIHSPWLALLFLAQTGFYTMALAHRLLRPAPRLGRLADAAFYFSLGSYATLLGVLDFFRGKRPDLWEPLKSDPIADPNHGR